MKAIFYASGPQFKRNFTLNNSSLLYNIDVFGLMCLILNIEKCPPSNGSLENVQPFLNRNKSATEIIVYSIGKFNNLSEIVVKQK